MRLKFVLYVFLIIIFESSPKIDFSQKMSVVNGPHFVYDESQLL